MNKTINLNLYQAIELFNLQHQLYQPLERFMDSSMLEGVIQEEFPLPILLTVEKKDFEDIEKGEQLDLLFKNRKVGSLIVEEKEIIDIKDYGKKLYKRLDHPGLKVFLSNHTGYLISGKVNKLKKISFEDYFNNKGWKTIAGFQTRNIPHIGHERIHRYALELVDGLMITPVLGIKKQGDFRNKVIKEIYEFYVSSFINENVVLHFLFLNMRYLGGREAAFHALVRKNLGCTHFIVGRDHAGAGNVYKPYEAQEEVLRWNIGIEIIPVKEVFYCNKCNRSLFEEECLHQKEKISASSIRSALLNNQPTRFLRKDIERKLKEISQKERLFFKEKDDYLENLLLEAWEEDGRMEA